MIILEFMFMLIIAGACGFIASQLMGARGFNLITLVILGFVGALIGRYVAGYFGLPPLFTLSFGGTSFPLVWTILGSALVVSIYTIAAQH